MTSIFQPSPQPHLFVHAHADTLEQKLPFDQHYYAEKSEAEGRQDLRALTPDSPVEEIWVFVEAVDAQGTKRTFWFEVGEEEENNKASTDPELYPQILSFLGTQSLSLTAWRHYHIHPYAATGEKEVCFQYAPWIVTPHDYMYFGATGLLNDYLKTEVPTLDMRIVTPFGLWSLDHAKKISSHSEDIQAYTESFKQSEKNLVAWYNKKTKVLQKKCASEKMQQRLLQESAEILSTPWAEVKFQTFE